MKNLPKILITGGAMALALLLSVFAGTALAAGAGVDESSWLDLARPVYDAIAHGRPALAAALALVLLVALAKRYVAPRWAPLQSEAGTLIGLLVMSFGSAMAIALTPTGVTLSLALLRNAGLVAVAAAGGWKILKVLIVTPILLPLRNKLPSFLRPVLDLILWVFDNHTEAVAKAEKAGVAAVKAKPAPGAAGITGAPRDMP